MNANIFFLMYVPCYRQVSTPYPEIPHCARKHWHPYANFVILGNSTILANIRNTSRFQGTTYPVSYVRYKPAMPVQPSYAVYAGYTVTYGHEIYKMIGGIRDSERRGVCFRLFFNAMLEY